MTITSSIDHIENGSLLSNIDSLLQNVKLKNKLQAWNCHSLCSLESTQAPPTLQSSSTTGWGLEEATGEWSAVCNKGDNAIGIAMVHRGHIGCSRVLCLRSAHHSQHLLMSWKPTLSPPALALLPSGARVPAGRGKDALLKGTQPAWTQPSGLLFHQPESNLTPSMAVIANEWRRKSRLTLAFGISSISSCTSYKGDSCQHTSGENETSCSPKAAGTCRVYRDNSTQGYPVQTAVDNCFT